MIQNCSPALILLIITSCVEFGETMDDSRDIKPGHQIIKEFHFHPYWAQHNKEQEAEALSLRDKIILWHLGGDGREHDCGL